MNKTEAAEILGLKAPFTAKQAKTSYRKLAMSAHPDKGGTNVKMQELNAAYNLCGGGISFGTKIGANVSWAVSDGELFETVFKFYRKRRGPSIEAVVRWFGQCMLDKLKANSHKGFTWRSDNADELFKRLTDELMELGDELLKPRVDKEKIIKECADVANFAMFIADKARRQL